MRTLFSYNIPLRIYEVAKECNISYPTAKKYITKLAKREIVYDIDIKSQRGKNFKKFGFNVKILEEIN